MPPRAAAPAIAANRARAPPGRARRRRAVVRHLRRDEKNLFQSGQRFDLPQRRDMAAVNRVERAAKNTEQPGWCAHHRKPWPRPSGRPAPTGQRSRTRKSGWVERRKIAGQQQPNRRQQRRCRRAQPRPQLRQTELAHRQAGPDGGGRWCGTRAGTKKISSSRVSALTCRSAAIWPQ